MIKKFNPFKLVNEDVFYNNWGWLTFLYNKRITRGSKQGYVLTMKTAHGSYRS